MLSQIACILGLHWQHRIFTSIKKAAQPAAAAEVAWRGEKLLKCVSLFAVKCILEEVGPRG